MALRDAILGILAEIGEAGIGSFFPEKYPEGRFWRRLGGGVSRSSRATFSVLLSRLQYEGLVERKGAKKSALWHVTQKGRQYLTDFTATKNPPQRDGKRRLVIFDIPEQEKGKREVIRRELIGIGYYQLQKSVWAGDFPLPSDFLNTLDMLNLKKHVHIFSVQQEGTLSDEI